ncbi:MAG TPA: STAS domain-containing protein [Isosphaeraceae bacterium]|jgi:anti-sigma B factor antagonist|nr:STAS domain-containing protein [Isosphaeraceae bacterium]
MLHLITHEVDGALVITCEAPTNASDDPGSTQREALYQAVASRADPRFAVDLGAIEYLASADIGFLIALRRRIETREGRLVLFDVHPILLDILRTMKLAKLFVFADDLSHALFLLANPATA